jgi:hypothetical protein
MMTMRVFRSGAPVAAAILLLAGCASSRDEQADVASASATAPEPESKLEKTAEKAGEIVTQPVRDLGAADPKIPDVLVKATVDPYALQNAQACDQMVEEIRQLNDALGPDFAIATEKKEENKTGKVVEAGGKAIVNSIIPFRGIVRELTGAAAAQRRLNDAIDAGYARRGFLRGIHSMRQCPAIF